MYSRHGPDLNNVLIFADRAELYLLYKDPGPAHSSGLLRAGPLRGFTGRAYRALIIKKLRHFKINVTFIHAPGFKRTPKSLNFTYDVYHYKMEFSTCPRLLLKHI